MPNTQVPIRENSDLHILQSCKKYQKCIFRLYILPIRQINDMIYILPTYNLFFFFFREYLEFWIEVFRNKKLSEPRIKMCMERRHFYLDILSKFKVSKYVSGLSILFRHDNFELPSLWKIQSNLDLEMLNFPNFFDIYLYF